MNMKKIVLACAALLCSSVAMAQVSYGLKAGVNLNKTTYDAFPADFKQVNQASFFLTGFAEIGLGNNFAIQPGLSIQGKGDKYTKDGNEAAKWDVMSIEIPVNMMYYIPTGESGSVVLGAGPYLGVNISGKNTINQIGAPTFGRVGEHDIKFTGSNKTQNLIDAGANLLLGYKLTNGLLINAEYGLGMADLNPSATDIFSNRTLRFGLGFQF